MHIQQRLKKGIAMLSAVLLLACTMSTACFSIPVYASSVDEDVIEKVTDTILNKAGLVLNRTAMKDFMTNFGDLINSEISLVVDMLDLNLSYIFNGCKEYDQYAEAIDKAVENSEIETILKGMDGNVWRMMSNNAKSFKDFVAYMHWIGDSDNALETYYRFLQFYLYGLPDVDDGTKIRDKDASLKSDLKGRRFDIPGRVVNVFKEIADDWIEEYAGYYILKVNKRADISPTWFSQKSLYDIVIQVIKDYPDEIIYFSLSGNIVEIRVPTACYYVSSKKTSDEFIVDLYDSNWKNSSFGRICSNSSDYVNGREYYLYNYDDENCYLNRNYGGMVHTFYSSKFAYNRIFSENIDSIKIFKSLDAMKNYTTGNQPFYYNSNYTSYDSSIDNSFEVGGDYIIDNSSNITYDTVNEEITNNYYDGISEEELQAILDAVLGSIDTSGSGSSGSGGSSGGSGDSGTSGGSVWDGLGDLMSGISSFFGFLLSLLGQLIELVSGFLTSVINLLGTMDVFSGAFSSFLSQSFTWIPKEIWDVLILGMTTIVAVAVINAFRK